MSFLTSQSILVFCYIFFLALDFFEHVKIQFCWSLESLISGQNGIKVDGIKVLNFNSLIFRWLVASMYLETFFEEVEAVLIKSVLMFLKYLFHQALLLLLGSQTNVKFLELIVLLTLSRLFLK